MAEEQTAADDKQDTIAGADVNPDTASDTPKLDATDAPDPPAAAPKPNGKGDEPKADADPPATLAAGGKADTPPVPQDFPDNWAELLADGDKKFQKELERQGSVKGVALWAKNANDRLRSGKTVTIPGKDATDEERAAFNKALGVPEKPDGYIDNIKLANDRVLGDDDKPIAQSFAQAMHPVGATPAQMSAAMDWYFDFQQAQVEQQAQIDSEFRVSSEVELKKEMGGDFARLTNAIPLLFQDAAPELMDRLLSARTPEGHLLGDDPVIVKGLARWASEMYPTASMHAPDGDGEKAMLDELAELRKYQQEKPEQYQADTRAQHRRAELLEMKKRTDARAA